MVNFKFNRIQRSSIFLKKGWQLSRKEENNINKYKLVGCYDDSVFFFYFVINRS